MPVKKSESSPHLWGGLLVGTAWLAGFLISRYESPAYLHLIALTILLIPPFFWRKTSSQLIPAPQNGLESPPTPASSPPSPADLPFDNEKSSAYSQPQTNEALAASFTLQLQLLCHNLNLTTAILVTANKNGTNLDVRAAYSSEELELAHSFPAESGIFVCLRQGRKEIAGLPSTPLFQGLPYYPNGHAVGSFFALTLERINNSCPSGYLCVDRAKADSWSEKEKELLRAASRKISLDIFLALQLADIDRDKKATNQVCLALQELNGVLGLETAFKATENAVRNLTGAEFVAITLRDKENHTIVLAQGPGSKDLEGSLVSEDTCLVNQAMTMQRTMPPRPEYNGPAPIFSQEKPMDGFGSLLILPLILKQEEPLGTLIVAGRATGLFSSDRQNILEVIGSQIATKIDLGRAHEKVFQLASTDGLTGLANHRTFQSALKNMTERCHRMGTEVAMLLCDIDYFKKVNDNYGHPFGDDVLREVAKVLHGSVRTIDLAARYGGEEFAVILENTDKAGALLLAERIRAGIEALRLACGTTPVTITMSIGISIYPSQSADPTNLIDKADQALYAAKEGGRNQVHCWPV
ncbi:MAG: GGDEF domain-containing protein [Thermodesulfobacteriota bacterium]